MKDEEIFELAESNGFQDDFGRWNFTDEELLDFVFEIRRAEREAILDEWHACVQADLEHGVKSLNEQAAEKWHKEYPAIAGFSEAIRARSNHD